ncbi:hypothetical protein [Roseibium sp. SCP14]|uniref:hypothetical protein n=1 Tax=Roseibium sp. SCP14 TaxID=3141375 RepID=UPI00333B2403
MFLGENALKNLVEFMIDAELTLSIAPHHAEKVRLRPIVELVQATLAPEGQSAVARKTFEITSSVHFLSALFEVVSEFENEPASSRKAITACLFAYHLREWIWKEHRSLIEKALGLKDQEAFYKYVNNCFPDFPLIREVCLGTKHFETNHNQVLNTGLSGGDFSPDDFSSADFYVGDLIVETGIGNKNALEMLKSVLRFYEKLFSVLGI